MIRIQSLAASVIVGLLISPLIVNANPKPFDPLQVYRDEIKQTETDASQTLLNQLGPDINDSNPYTNTQPSQSSPSTPSKHGRAFSPPTTTQKNISPNTREPQTNNTNPWEKPNPWAAQSKVNPWANAPIPGPTPTTPSSSNSSFAQISPPNIFAPSQPASMPKKPSNKSTNTTY